MLTKCRYMTLKQVRIVTTTLQTVNTNYSSDVCGDANVLQGVAGFQYRPRPIAVSVTSLHSRISAYTSRCLVASFFRNGASDFYLATLPARLIDLFVTHFKTKPSMTVVICVLRRRISRKQCETCTKRALNLTETYVCRKKSLGKVQCELKQQTQQAALGGDVSNLRSVEAWLEAWPMHQFPDYRPS